MFDLTRRRVGEDIDIFYVLQRDLSTVLRARSGRIMHKFHKSCGLYIDLQTLTLFCFYNQSEAGGFLHSI